MSSHHGVCVFFFLPLDTCFWRNCALMFLCIPEWCSSSPKHWRVLCSPAGFLDSCLELRQLLPWSWTLCLFNSLYNLAKHTKYKTMCCLMFWLEVFNFSFDQILQTNKILYLGFISSFYSQSFLYLFCAVETFWNVWPKNTLFFTHFFVGILTWTSFFHNNVFFIISKEH